MVYGIFEEINLMMIALGRNSEQKFLPSPDEGLKVTNANLPDISDIT